MASLEMNGKRMLFFFQVHHGKTFCSPEKQLIWNELLSDDYQGFANLHVPCLILNSFSLQRQKGNENQSRL